MLSQVLRKTTSSVTLRSSIRMASTQSIEYAKAMNVPLVKSDPVLFDLLEKEKKRQRDSLVLIASENYTSTAVLDSLGSVITNKYSEGYPAQRYYGGNEFVDAVEILCQNRALNAFNLDPNEWGVNVQSLSGSPANLQVYASLLQPHDSILSLGLTNGGHLSHGHQTQPTEKNPTPKPISKVSQYYTTHSYTLNPETETIDYDLVEKMALEIKPKLLLAGASAYPRKINFKRMREIADKVGAALHSDVAHIAGLLVRVQDGTNTEGRYYKDLPEGFEGDSVNGECHDAFKYSDIVTTTTHKSLRGPRGAMIFFRKGTRTLPSGNYPTPYTTVVGDVSTDSPPKITYTMETRVNNTVFPGLQGGPHNHTITALATALAQTQLPSFKFYQSQVLKNSKQLSNSFLNRGYELVSGGTDNHMILVNIKKSGKNRKLTKDDFANFKSSFFSALTPELIEKLSISSMDGARLERVCELVQIVVNKNTVLGDKSAINPGGIRLGTPALTTRGLTEEDMEKVAQFFDEAVMLALAIQAQASAESSEGPVKLSGFKKFLGDGNHIPELVELREKVKAFSNTFPYIGQ